MPKPDAESSSLLLAGALLPITKTMTFFEETADSFVDRFLATRGRAVQERTGHQLTARRVSGTLPQLLRSLEPLVSAEARRYLFLDTRAGWSLFLDNNWRGTDPGSPMTAFAAAGLRSVAVTYAPNTYDRRTNIGFHGSRRIEVAWPDTAARFGFSARSLGVRVNDSGRWDFDDDGPRLAFENASLYTARRKQDRVTLAMLTSYAAAFSLAPFDEAFYAPASHGFVVEHTDPPIPGCRQFRLEEAVSGRPFELIGEPAR